MFTVTYTVNGKGGIVPFSLLATSPGVTVKLYLPDNLQNYLTSPGRYFWEIRTLKAGKIYLEISAMIILHSPWNIFYEFLFGVKICPRVFYLPHYHPVVCFNIASRYDFTGTRASYTGLILTRLFPFRLKRLKQKKLLVNKRGLGTPCAASD